MTRVARTMTIAVVSLLAVAVAPATGQDGDDCGERASLRVAVLDESGTVALPGATVVLRWHEARRRPVREAADTQGRFFLCVPRDAREATLWAELGDGSSEQAVVAFEPGDVHEVELRVLVGTVRAGRIIGRVYDGVTGDAVATAAVSVRGRGRQAQSNRRGRFVLSAVPEGQHELEVGHIGYAPLGHAVTVTRGLTTEVEIGLVPTPVEMEPLVATVTRSRRLEIKGFYERKLWGELVSGGTFFTAADIERRQPLHISHMITELSGIRLGPSGKFQSTRLSAGFSGAGCNIKTFLDSVDVSDVPIDTIVRPIEIGGVEIYKGPASLPAEFGGSDTRCGAIVIWTK
ncbi:MAG: TonB-dependent receptor [Gemmatimonadales bacterium]|nr:TonB-dependent receptor [Candidatus Palauibacter irciniicola]MYC17570.1 TonB-dependent receptor [Gemmatimonadales bacterium]